MKTWNQLFVRHGWLLEKIEENTFGLRTETEANVAFLLKSLERSGVEYILEGSKVILKEDSISEQKWINTVDFQNRDRGGDLWFRPGKEEPKVQELDTYICGIVRQLNRMGFQTIGSCDGHGRGPAQVIITKEGKSMELLVQMLHVFGIKRVNYREHSSNFTVSFPLNRSQLLDLAENISMVEESLLEQGEEFIKEQIFYLLLEKLLTIPGASGNENVIRAVVIEQLTPYVDSLTVDRFGNILAEKTYRSGHGPTILLNAHLDIVCELEPERVIIKENGIWSSSKGILGADDRAGVAILLHMAQYLNDSSFSGKVKFIFTVQEEVGLIGADQVDDYFLWGTDAAIVVDRRGSGDIVTSCGGYFPFCDEQYGHFFENVARDKGFHGWKCTPGGSSDTRIWASHGIQSVNLSVGYKHEHTENESLDSKACYQTTKLLIACFEKASELRRLLKTYSYSKK
jgi:putative aminopeptidase FrvX